MGGLFGDEYGGDCSSFPTNTKAKSRKLKQVSKKTRFVSFSGPYKPPANKGEKDELILAYSMLLLADGGLDVTENKLSKVIEASGNDVEPSLPGIYARATKSLDINSIIASISGTTYEVAEPLCKTTYPYNKTKDVLTVGSVIMRGQK